MPTYDDKTRTAGLPFVTKLARVILVDARPTTMLRRKEMVGLLKMPATLFMDVKQTVAWRFDEMANPLRGMACDVNDRGLNLVFPVLTDEELRASKGNSVLTFDELISLWHKYEHTLKDV